MKAKAYTTEGKARSAGVELPESLFDGTVSESALHQVVKAHRANQRQGTAATKNRAKMTSGGRKPWRQKGTGRARAGTIRSPLWRGGAVVFGPQPRDYSSRVPKKVRQLAVQSALNARALEGDLLVIEPFGLEAPRTKDIVRLMSGLEIENANTLILTNGVNRNVYLSGRNLPGVQIKPWGEASAYDVLWSDVVVVEETALTGTAEGDEEES